MSFAEEKKKNLKAITQLKSATYFMRQRRRLGV